MSKYTTELRFICETLCGCTESQGLSKVEEIISKSAPLIFDFDYPIFDKDYKIPLETKIIRHYYLREIGFETLGIWKLKLNDKLNEIMPYFNQLYESELLKFNPLVDVDVKTTSNTADKGNTDISQSDTKNTTETETKKDVFSSAEHSAFESSKSGTSTAESKNDGTLTNASSSSNSGTTSDSSTSSKSYDDYDDYSDTPQGSVGNLDNLTYLTNARHKHGNSSDTTTAKGTSKGELTSSSTDTSKSTGTNKETTAGTESTTNDKTFNSSDNVDSSRKGSASANMSSNTNTTNTQDYLENIIGKRGGQTYSAMLNEFRKTFLNIDKMIMDELSDLFMTIY